MRNPRIGEEIEIKLTGIKGRVIGIHYSECDASRFNIRYASTTGEIIESWLEAGELSEVKS